jgi:hypothetical protein
MPIGIAYQRHLTQEAQGALRRAGDILTDTLFTDLAYILTGRRPVHETAFADYLPPKHLPKYTPGFCKQWFTCVLTVMWKLAQPRRLRLSCVAEELAAHALLEQAQAEIDEAADEGRLDKTTAARAKEGFYYLEGLLFEDLDFLLLYEAAYDGIEDSDRAREANLVYLSFVDWFKPFGAPESRTPPRVRYTAVHPYVEDDTPDQCPPDAPRSQADAGPGV